MKDMFRRKKRPTPRNSQKSQWFEYLGEVEVVIVLQALKKYYSHKAYNEILSGDHFKKIVQPGLQKSCTETWNEHADRSSDSELRIRTTIRTECLLPAAENADETLKLFKQFKIPMITMRLAQLIAEIAVRVDSIDSINDVPWLETDRDIFILPTGWP